jgi:hypothetical protein
MQIALMFVALLAVAGRAFAQAPQTPQHIVGNRVGSHWQMVDASTRTVSDTITLSFQGREGGPQYTVDFITRHPVLEPVPASGVVDIIVSQHPVEDDAPLMTWRVDGETVPVVTRLNSRRSVVATVSLAEFDRIARAGVVVDRTFDTELELGPGQVRMLRLTADRWLGRVR